MSRHLRRRPIPGREATNRGIWLVKRAIFPGVPILLAVSLLVNPLEIGWAMVVGPYLYFIETCVLAVALWYFVLGAGQKLTARHRRAMIRTSTE